MSRAKRKAHAPTLRGELLEDWLDFGRRSAKRMFTAGEIAARGGLEVVARQVLRGAACEIDGLEAGSPVVVRAWQVAKRVPVIDPTGPPVAILPDGRVVPAKPPRSIAV